MSVVRLYFGRGTPSRSRMKVDEPLTFSLQSWFKSISSTTSFTSSVKALPRYAFKFSNSSFSVDNPCELWTRIPILKFDVFGKRDRTRRWCMMDDDSRGRRSWAALDDYPERYDDLYCNLGIKNGCFAFKAVPVKWIVRIIVTWTTLWAHVSTQSTY